MQPYRLRTGLRRALPWWLINLGLASKGKDCESKGGNHEWYNLDGATSGCYHCVVVRVGQLWQVDLEDSKLTGFVSRRP